MMQTSARDIVCPHTPTEHKHRQKRGTTDRYTYIHTQNTYRQTDTHTHRKTDPFSYGFVSLPYLPYEVHSGSVVLGPTKCFVEKRIELIFRDLWLDPFPTQYEFFSADAYRCQGSRDMVLIVFVFRFSKPSLLDSFGDLDCGP